MHTEETKRNIAKGVAAYYSSRSKDVAVCNSCGNEFVRRRNRPASVACSKSCAKKIQYSPNREARSKFKDYQAECQFKFALSDYPDKFDFSLVEKFGWYSAANRGNNLNGVSRDHMLSITDGYKQGVHPYYISHPANCQLLQQRDNSSKRTKSSIDFAELMERIDNWNV